MYVVMTKTEKRARMYQSMGSAFEDGAAYMLKRVCKYLESEHPTWYEHFGDELKKAMEE